MENCCVCFDGCCIRKSFQEEEETSVKIDNFSRQTEISKGIRKGEGNWNNKHTKKVAN